MEAAPGVRGGTLAPVAPTKSKLSAVITIGLVTPKEADELLAKLTEQREKEAREKAAAASAPAGPAESAPPPRTPPGPSRGP
jgi:hypothetical protein